MSKRLLSIILLAAVPAVAQDAHRHESGGSAPTATPRAQPGADPSYSRFTRQMNAGMSTMMSAMHAPGPSGSPDVDFLAMMIPHHEGAVEMARLELIHGRDPATRRLAEDIIANQTVEIEGMKRRLEALRGNRES